MEMDSSWIYLLFFLAFPLIRIIPRMLGKRKKNSSRTSQRIPQEKRQIQTSKDEYDNDKYSRKPYAGSSSSNLSAKNMLVLGELVRGLNTFEKIQKNTGLDNKELDGILEYLEKNEMLKVHQKKGLAGTTKIQLHPTDKGFREYYS